MNYANTNRKVTPKFPKTYGDLLARYTVAVKRDTKNGFQNVAIGQFPLSKVPDGKYRIYYFRPKNRNRILGLKSTSSSAQDKIQRVGKGQEFYIFDRNSSQSPSKQHSLAESQSCSVRSSQVDFDNKDFCGDGFTQIQGYTNNVPQKLSYSPTESPVDQKLTKYANCQQR